MYAAPEGEPLGNENLICETSDLGETVDLNDCLDTIRQSYGDETGVIIGLANWGPANLRLMEVCREIRYVSDHGEGFTRLNIAENDGKTVFPGSMAVLQVSPEEIAAEGGEIGLDRIFQTAEGGDSGGCSTLGGLHVLAIFGLPFLSLLLRKR